MSSGRRKRRAVILLALALACGGLAASRVQTREHEVEAAVGPLVPVVVTRADVAPGDRLKPQQLAVRQVPERFAPRDALAVPDDVAGQRAAGAIAAGGYVTAGSLQSAATQPDGQPAPGTPVRRGERSVDLAVAGGAALADAPPGTRVDVIVTSEPRGGSGGGRTYLALQDVELLAARAADDGGAGPAAAGSASDGAAAHATTVATLRVTLKQAVFLTAAQSFAREIRLLERAPGDRRAAPPLAVSAGGL
jgi:pilus assembly protein CpaB